MKIKKFDDCWQEARKLTKMVYSVTKNSKFKNDLRLSGQIQSASTSIMANPVK